MTKYRNRISWLELVLVLCLTLVLYLRHIDQVSFFSDESQWVNTSSSLEALLPGDQPQAIDWEHSYWTLTQPPVARYIIGLGRLAGGYQVSELNQPWAYNIDEASNIALGYLPQADLLWWSRLPMAIIAALSGVILFFIAYKVGGRPAGYIFLLLYLTNPYTLMHLRRAMAESPLLLGTLLVIITGYLAIQSTPLVTAGVVLQGKWWLRPLAWLLLMAALCGLTGAIKLNGLLLLGAVLWLWLLIWWKIRRSNDLTKHRILLVGFLLLPLAAIGTFIIVNPFLYPAPLARTLEMVQHRADEMRTQQAGPGEYAFPPGEVTTRLSVVPWRFIQYSTAVTNTSLHLMLAILVGVGFYVLGQQAVGWWRGKQESGMSVAILSVAAVTIAPVLFTPLDWDRYYLLPVIFFMLCIALGLATIVNGLWKSGENMVYAAGSSK